MLTIEFFLAFSLSLSKGNYFQLSSVQYNLDPPSIYMMIVSFLHDLSCMLPLIKYIENEIGKLRKIKPVDKPISSLYVQRLSFIIFIASTSDDILEKQ